MDPRAPTPEEVELARAAIGSAGGRMAPPAPPPGFIPEPLGLEPAGPAGPQGFTAPPPPPAAPPPPPGPALQQFLQAEGGYSPKEAGAIATAPPAARSTKPLPAPGFGRPRGGGGGRPAPSKLDSYLASEYGPDVRAKREPLGIPETEAERSIQYQLDESELENAQEMFDAQEKARVDMLAAQERQMAEQEKADLEAQERARQRQAHLQSMEAKFSDLANSIANEPIDSQRLWNRKNTGEKVLSFLALGLAGGAVGGAEGAKWALDRLDVEVQRDIDDQKANKALQQSKLAAQDSLIGMARARFATEAEQDNAMREIMYRRAAMELEKSAEFAQRPERQAAYTALFDGLQQRQADVAQQRRLASDQYEAQRQAALRASMVRPDPLKEAARRSDLLVKLHENEKKLRGGDTGSETFVAPGVEARTPAEALDLRKKLAVIDSSKKVFEDLLAETQNASGLDVALGGTKYPLTNKPLRKGGDRLATKRSIAVGKLGVLSGSGTVNAGEYPRLLNNLESVEGIKGVLQTLDADRKGTLGQGVVTDPAKARSNTPVKVRR